MNNKNIVRIAIIVLLIVVVTIAASFITVPYTIKAKAVFIPASEFNLTRTLEGNLISTYKDNVKSVVKNYGITEFQRGDVVEFVLAESISDKEFIDKGDTIGWIYSNEEQRKLILLKGQLDILSAELEFYTTGQKPEDVQKAKEQLDLAQQELETQRKLMARSSALFNDSVISEQEFEIEENRLRVKEIALKIAKANYASITTGEKPEQEKLINAQILAIKDQINQVSQRINYFTITSPLSGVIQLERGPGTGERIISVGDTSNWVGMIPVQFKERKHIRTGNKIDYMGAKGHVVNMDNKISLIDNRQAFYLTAVWPYKDDIFPGTIGEVMIQCEKISLIEYFVRLFEFSPRQ
jgi:multidrug efflux pump subunit AcrA (membrane-fusion protein)